MRSSSRRRVVALITHKPSERLPGKNEWLAGFTARWLEYCKARCPELEVVCVGASEFVGVPDARQLIVDEGNHLADIEEAVRRLGLSETDIVVLPQLTNPIREWWLLDVCLNALCYSGEPVTTCYQKRDESWRVVNTAGEGSPHVVGDRQLRRDGGLYVGYVCQMERLFEPRAGHTLIVRSRLFAQIDVDERDDLPPLSVLLALEGAAMREMGEME